MCVCFLIVVLFIVGKKYRLKCIYLYFIWFQISILVNHTENIIWQRIKIYWKKNESIRPTLSRDAQISDPSDVVKRSIGRTDLSLLVFYAILDNRWLMRLVR